MSFAVILCENAQEDENSIINTNLGKSEIRASTWQKNIVNKKKIATTAS